MKPQADDDRETVVQYDPEKRGLSPIADRTFSPVAINITIPQHVNSTFLNHMRSECHQNVAFDWLREEKEPLLHQSDQRRSAPVSSDETGARPLGSTTDLHTSCSLHRRGSTLQGLVIRMEQRIRVRIRASQHPMQRHLGPRQSQSPRSAETTSGCRSTSSRVGGRYLHQSEG